MPPRWVSLGIVAFWLASMGWLAWREILPDFRPGEPPPFAIDVFDEVHRQKPEVRWTVFRNGKQLFAARTGVHHREQPDDTFAFTAELTPPVNAPFVYFGLVELTSMSTLYRIDRAGDLVEVEVRIRAKPHHRDTSESVEWYLGGPIVNGVFRPRQRINVSGEVHHEGQLDPVEVSFRGAVLLLMHPVHRISGLRPGQTWRVPLVDPLETALSSVTNYFAGKLLPFGAVPVHSSLTARVLPESQSLHWQNEEVPCQVIDYDGAEVSGRTWVRLSDGAVLCQEITRGGDHLKMVRDY